MKCIAIDDEPIDLSIIRQYCERINDITLETYTSPVIGLQRITEWNPDVVFLDIELNGSSGVELAQKIPSTCCIIFTTAYPKYAVDGFEVNAIDFLLKPFFFKRFEQAIFKVQRWLKMNNLLKLSEASERKITLNVEYKNVNISIDSIIYIESIDNYIKVHLDDGSTILSKIPLWNILEQLPESEFLRIHRSFIVAINRIAKHSRSEITLAVSNKTLPIGKKYLPTVTERLLPD